MEFSRTQSEFKMLIPGFLKDYLYVLDELDSGFPIAFGPVTETTILVDSDHAHDKKTHRSLTGWITFVDSNPVAWQNKWQGSAASSTYTAEFAAMCIATEEAMSLLYTLFYLGCNVPANSSCPTKAFNGNFSVVQNCQNPTVALSKIHVAISYHVVREAVAAGIIEPYWIKGGYNMTDILTKLIPKPQFVEHYKYIFWLPNFHLHNHNCLSETKVEAS